MNHKKYLLETLQNAIDGNINYSRFEELFYTYYINGVRDDELSEKDHDFFTEIQEKFEYTTANQPSEEDRKYGYISYAEFLEWLKGKNKF